MEDRFKFRWFYKPLKMMIDFDIKMFDDYMQSENYIPMQCTGLKDKNGKLIYEGDIVTFEKSEKTGKLRKGIVKYYPNYCWFFVEVEENQWARPFNTIPDRQYLEVIGNIWEDKDLLKEGKE